MDQLDVQSISFEMARFIADPRDSLIDRYRTVGKPQRIDSSGFCGAAPGRHRRDERERFTQLSERGLER